MSNDIQPLLDELFALTFHGIKPGLERIGQLLESIGDPHMRFPVVHVAGTNGKGSTCSMIASILTSAGYKVGLYTSPHIYQFNERIRIDGSMISDVDTVRLASPLLAQARAISGTFFEVTTAMAFKYFAEQRVDVAIIETGLGGRLDATNVVTPVLSVITQIAFDHTEYLGNTIAEIATEKAGIIKPNVPIVLSSQRAEFNADVRAAVAEKALAVRAPLTLAAELVHVELDRIHPDFTMTVSVIDGLDLHYHDVGLGGEHQVANVATTLAAVQSLRSLFFIDQECVDKGLVNIRANTGLFGRINLLHSSPITILDVAHNPAGIETLVNTLMSATGKSEKWNVVFGVMADKDANAMMAALQSIAGTLHLCSPTVPRAMSSNELEALAQNFEMPYVAHSSVADAYIAARILGATVVCGSFHVADEVIQFERSSLTQESNHGPHSPAK